MYFYSIFLILFFTSCSTIPPSNYKLCCPETKLVGFSEVTAKEKQALEVARIGCMRYFGRRSPCLKVFIKSGIDSFQAICGGKDVCD